MTNEETINAWLHNHKADVHNSKRTIFSQGGNLYSYGTHYLLATRMGGTVRVNRAKYSATTSTHSGLVARLAERKGLYVRDCNWNEDDGSGLK